MTARISTIEKAQPICTVDPAFAMRITVRRSERASNLRAPTGLSTGFPGPRDRAGDGLVEPDRGVQAERLARLAGARHIALRRSAGHGRTGNLDGERRRPRGRHAPREICNRYRLFRSHVVGVAALAPDERRPEPVREVGRVEVR